MAFSPRRYRRIERGNRTRVILCGLLGSAGFHLLFVWGQQRVSVAVAAVVMATMPMLVALGEVTFLQHRLTARHVVGIALCTAGCVAIGMAAGNAGGTSLLGAGAIAMAAIVWAGVTVSTAWHRAPLRRVVAEHTRNAARRAGSAGHRSTERVGVHFAVAQGLVAGDLARHRQFGLHLLRDDASDDDAVGDHCNFARHDRDTVEHARRVAGARRRAGTYSSWWLQRW